MTLNLRANTDWFRMSSFRAEHLRVIITRVTRPPGLPPFLDAPESRLIAAFVSVPLYH